MRTCCTLLLFLIIPWFSLAQSAKQYPFNIPSQDVNSAIVELALQRELNVVFLAHLAKNTKTNAVIGDYKMDEALALMLAGTGFRAKISNNRAILIERERVKTTTAKPYPKPAKNKPQPNENLTELSSAPLTLAIERIEVVGKLISPYNLAQTTSSTKSQRDFLQVPQIVAALPKTLFTDIAARNYSDASQLTSSVNYLERNAGVTDELRLRGFAYPALKVNGISSHAYVAPLDIAFIDNLEIAKGPNSVIFGRMEPGGVINMMTKRPGVSQRSIMLSKASDSYARAELDLSWTILNDVHLRAIGFVQQQGAKQSIDLNDAHGAMIAMEHQFDHGGVLSIHYRYQSQKALQSFGRPIEGFDSDVQFFKNEEGGVDVVTSREDDLRAKLDLDRHSINLSVGDWLLGEWSADFHLQFDSYQSQSAISYPVIDQFLIDVDGETISQEDVTEALLADPELFNAISSGLTELTINLDELTYEGVPFSYDTSAISAEATLYNIDNLGAISFEQLYGINVNHSEPESLIWQTHDTRGNFLPIEQNEVLFDPDLENRRVKDTNIAIFAQWVANWQQLTSFIGARLDRLDFNADNITGNINKDYTQTSFRFGLMYQLSETMSIYGNFSESFSPQFDVDEAPLLGDDEDNEAGRIIFLPPATSQQREWGLKKQWFDGKLQSSCAWFHIIKRDIDAAANTQENQGVECDIAGSLKGGWHLNLATSFNDSKIVDADDETLIGNHPRMTPKSQIKAWLSKDFQTWGDIPARWSLGYTHVDHRYVDSSNEDRLDAYHLIDMALSLTFNHSLSGHFSVKNITDEQYTAGAFNALPFWTNQGQQRTFEARLEYFF